MFFISAVNFTCMYWIDKWLVLRFYSIPKNYDDKIIKYSLASIKWAFLFHFITGTIMLSNPHIMDTNSIAYLKNVVDGHERYGQFHVVLFIVGGIVILIVVLFENYLLKACCKMRLSFGDIEAISDDYYDEIHVPFLINEYERAKQGQKDTLSFIDKIKARADFKELKIIRRSALRTNSKKMRSYSR